MSRTSIRIAAALVGIVLLVAGGVYFFDDTYQEIRAVVAVAEALDSDPAGYQRATHVRDFAFPRDHGPHPDFRTEWWYYTGNLDAEGGRHFGYQFTIFRIALKPPSREDTVRASDWATRQIYMGHLALSDVEGEAFHAFERFSRGAAGLAGAQADPFRVWLEEWSVAGGEENLFPVHLQAAHDGVALDLTLRPLKPEVLQGDRGLDQKGPGEGNASYYYSYTRLATEGTVTVDGTTHDVRGLSWMDREWSTSALADGQVGWDWFALQLDNGMDLMYYQIRQADGSASPYTSGVLVFEEGRVRHLTHRDVRLDVQETWRSPHTDAVYPARWRLQVPSEDVDLIVKPHLADQELNVSVKYWEGAVYLEGTIGGEPVAGDGYIEMTGYGDNEVRPTP